jgi:hypothetical protein
VKKLDIDNASGLIEEAELEALATGEAIGGTSNPIPVIATTFGIDVALFGVTLNGGACPTSACTKSCG